MVLNVKFKIPRKNNRLELGVFGALVELLDVGFGDVVQDAFVEEGLGEDLHFDDVLLVLLIGAPHV